jgi:hypothetical protein
MPALIIEDSTWDVAEAVANFCNMAKDSVFYSVVSGWRYLRGANGPNKAPDGVLRGKSAIKRFEWNAKWKGPRGALVKALLECGFAIREGGKIRLKGFSRYIQEWKEKMDARRRAKESRERRKTEAAEAAKEMVGQNRRETDQISTKLISIDRNSGTDADGTPLHDHPVGFWTWMMRERHGFREVNADRAPMPSFEAWYRKMKSEGVSDWALSASWVAFLGDDHFRSRRWPVAVFITEGVFRPRLAQRPA